ncbi:MAG: hypothetical protein R3E90_16475 [Marinicella sp.]
MKNQETQYSKNNFNKSFVGRMVLFTISLQAVYLINAKLDLSWVLRVVLAIIPSVALAYALLALAALIRNGDEMFKKIMVDSFVVTGLITLTWVLALGLLQQFNVIPYLSFYWVFFIMVITFCIGYWLIMRKY